MNVAVKRALVVSAVSGLLVACGGKPAEGEGPKAPSTDVPAVTEKNCCKGKNDCKGKSGCRAGENASCAGKNDCRGKGTSCPTA